MGNKNSKGSSSHAVVTTKSANQQQKSETAGKAVVKVLIGVVNLTPIGKIITKAAIVTADKVDHGSATKYLGKTNTTLDILPGGNLAQAIASSATKGKSDNTLAKFDPKATVVKTVKTEAKSTLQVIAPAKPTIRPSLSQSAPAKKAIPSFSTKTMPRTGRIISPK